jgi:replicative DNA helicase
LALLVVLLHRYSEARESHEKMKKNPGELPHDILAERSLIGGLLLDGQSFDDISDKGLKREDFYHPQYGMIFEVIKDLSYSRSPIDYVTVCSKLNDLGQLEIVGGQTGIVEIAEEQVSTANVSHYAQIVKDKSSMREIIRTAQRLADIGVNYNGPADDFIAEVEASFFKLTNEAKSGKMIKINQALIENLKALEDTSRVSGQISGLSTGYDKLDQILLGMQAGQLIILAARPAMGKTAFALNIALNVVENTQLPVAIFSLEMVASELSMRLLTGKAKVDSKRFRTKNFLDTDMKNIANAVKKLSTYPIFINDSGSVTLVDIQSQCRKIKAEMGLGLIVIDYLQLMRSHGKHNSREQEISEISRGIKAMAKELGCPVLALSQLNRSVESRPNKRPNVSDLRESGSIEQDADVVMMIYRDEVYNQDTKEKGVAEIIVGKNRAGQVDTAKLAFVGAYTSFESLTYEPAPSQHD